MLSQNKKTKYYEMLRNGNTDVALVRIVEDIYSDIESKMQESQRDSVFKDLEPAKSLAKKVAVDEIIKFKTEVDQQVNSILASIKDFEVETSYKVDERMQNSLKLALRSMEEVKKTYSGNMAQVQAIVAKRIEAVVADLESKRGPQGPRGKEGKPGIDGKTPKDGKNGINGSPDKPDDIIKKINKSEKKIKASQIEGLETRQVGATRGGGGGMGNAVTEAFACDGSLTSFTLANKVASSGIAIQVMYQGQVLETTTHYSVSGKSLSLTFTPDNNTVIFVWYIRA